MAFQLVIAEGKEAGREFVFDQTSVLLGRTSECDVILYEPGVSRAHARIYAEGPAFFVEDLGSSNGTKVNGSSIKKHELKNGDAIALGPVVFSFSAGPDATFEEPEPDAAAGNHTRVVSAAELKRSRNRGVAMVPKDVGRDELEVLGRKSTLTISALKARASAPRPSGPRARASAPRALPPEVDQEVGARLAKLTVEDQALDRADTGPRKKLGEKATPQGRALSAAERARIKRETGGAVMSAARIWWAEASQARRTAAVVGVAAVGVALVLGALWLIVPRGEVKVLKEPTALSTEPIESSFGLGRGVTFEHADEKTFDFEVKAPVQALAIVHFQCKDISPQEVMASANGAELGYLPADTLDADAHSYELLVPAQVVKRNQTNKVTFDNLKNPPAVDPWRIWNVWIEVVVLPEKGAAGLAVDAEDAYGKARTKWDQRDIGASNRWEAYRFYREAWLTLEALPAGSRPATYQLARDAMNEVRKELDLTCNKLLLEARSEFNQKQEAQADATLDQVKQFFPTKAHPCQRRAQLEREEFAE